MSRTIETVIILVCVVILLTILSQQAPKLADALSDRLNKAAQAQK